MLSFPIDQLAFHLPFDESTGMHVRDSSPANRNFVIEGQDIGRFTGPYLYTGLPGYTGPYSFTGPCQCTGLSAGGQGLTGCSYIVGETGTYGDVSTGNFSLACWVKTFWNHDVAKLNNYNLCSKSPDTYYPYFEIGLEQTHWYCVVDFYTGNKNDVLVTQGLHKIVENSWVHIALTVEREPGGIVTRFYINGVLQDSSIGRGVNTPYHTKSLSNTGPFRIFKVEEQDIVEYGHHIISDFWFFNNHLLTQEEIVQLFRVLG